jgi:hypothetical protein
MSQSRMVTTTPSNSLVCDVCGKSFSSKYYISKHQKTPACRKRAQSINIDTVQTNDISPKEDTKSKSIKKSLSEDDIKDLRTIDQQIESLKLSINNYKQLIDEDFIKLKKYIAIYETKFKKI